PVLHCPRKADSRPCSGSLHPIFADGRPHLGYAWVSPLRPNRVTVGCPVGESMRGVAQPRNQQPGQTRPPRTASAMIFAILPMVVIARGMAGLFTQCSFNPGGPAINPETAPTVDAAAELRRAADRADLPAAE